LWLRMVEVQLKWMEIYSLGHHEGSGTAWTLSVLVLAGLN
jgi:hypothetical protein